MTSKPLTTVVHVVTGLGDGGAEGVLYRLCTRDREFEHIVVSVTTGGKYGVLLAEAGVETHCLGMSRGRLSGAALYQLFRILRTVRPCVIQTWMYHSDLVGGLVARLSGRQPVVWGIRNSTLVAGQSRRSTIAVAAACARLSRWIPRKIVVCAESAARVHAELGYDASKMVVIPNGYDLEAFGLLPEARRELRDGWGVADDVPLIGMVGRFDPQKDHANLLSALGILLGRGARFLCVMIGNGVDSSNDRVLQQIRSKGLEDRVRLLGRRTDIPAVMNALDLHVLSSAFGEAFPNVVAEAMACGTPCVITDVGDAAAIAGETGWVVPASAPGALADAMEEALEEWTNRTTWRKRQEEARRRIEGNFSIEGMVAAYHKVWREAVESGACS